MTDRKQNTAKTDTRHLVVSGFFKKDTTATAADKMMKVLEAETAAGQKQAYTA